MDRVAYWVYIMASGPRGTLYVGVTGELGRRVWEHRTGQGSRFVTRYGVARLVYAEAFEEPLDAIAFEKRLKRWRRAWKIALIEKANPHWADISGQIH
jgi:putative endonuclease